MNLKSGIHTPIIIAITVDDCVSQRRIDSLGSGQHLSGPGSGTPLITYLSPDVHSVVGVLILVIR